MDFNPLAIVKGWGGAGDTTGTTGFAGSLKPKQRIANGAKRDRKYAVIAIDEHRFDVRNDLSFASQMVSGAKRHTRWSLPLSLRGHFRHLQCLAFVVCGVPCTSSFQLIRAIVAVLGVPRR